MSPVKLSGGTANQQLSAVEAALFETIHKYGEKPTQVLLMQISELSELIVVNTVKALSENKISKDVIGLIDKSNAVYAEGSDTVVKYVDIGRNKAVKSLQSVINNYVASGSISFPKGVTLMGTSKVTAQSTVINPTDIGLDANNLEKALGAEDIVNNGGTVDIETVDGATILLQKDSVGIVDPITGNTMWVKFKDKFTNWKDRILGFFAKVFLTLQNLYNVNKMVIKNSFQ